MIGTFKRGGLLNRQTAINVKDSSDWSAYVTEQTDEEFYIINR